MTVCVAALADDGKVAVTASDRMLTYADEIEFEPHQRKHFPLTDFALALFAGETGTGLTVLREVRERLSRRAPFQEIARQYRAVYEEIHQREAEAAVLMPVGLTFERFHEGQAAMAQEFLVTLTERLYAFELPGIECLIVGVDEKGAHIYQCAGGHVVCADSPGFAAIGIGASHSESHFMDLRYARQLALDEALLATFFAKKRGEIAPGVGRETDMAILGPAVGERRYLHDHQPALDQMYEEQRTWMAAGRVIDRVKMNKFARETLNLPVVPFPEKRAEPTKPPEKEPAQPTPQSPQSSRDGRSRRPPSRG